MKKRHFFLRVSLFLFCMIFVGEVLAIKQVVKEAYDVHQRGDFDAFYDFVGEKLSDEWEHKKDEVKKEAEQLSKEFYKEIEEFFAEVKEEGGTYKEILDRASVAYQAKKLDRAEELVIKAFNLAKEEGLGLFDFVRKVSKNKSWKKVNRFLAFIRKVAAWSELFEEKFIEAQNSDVKKLQDNLSKNKERAIIQLTSLDQYQEDMKKLYGLKCGFFVLYNLMHINKLLQGSYQHSRIPSKTFLGTGQNEKEREEDFKTWMAKQEDFLLEGIKNNRCSGEYKKTTEMKMGESTEDIELSAEHISYLFSNQENFSLEDQKNIAILGVECNEIGGLESKTVAETVFSGALYPTGDDIYSKILRFRNNGTPLFIVFLRRGHWLSFVMTKHGAYVANSYGNEDKTLDLEVQKIYDFFLVGKIMGKGNIIEKEDVKKNILRRMLDGFYKAWDN
ncbi:MAG: hypothetical protein V1855_03945, partial [bacterium]